VSWFEEKGGGMGLADVADRTEFQEALPTPEDVRAAKERGGVIVVWRRSEAEPRRGFVDYQNAPPGYMAEIVAWEAELPRDLRSYVVCTYSTHPTLDVFRVAYLEALAKPVDVPEYGTTHLGYMNTLVDAARLEESRVIERAGIPRFTILESLDCLTVGFFGDVPEEVREPVLKAMTEAGVLGSQMDPQAIRTCEGAVAGALHQLVQGGALFQVADGTWRMKGGD